MDLARKRVDKWNVKVLLMAYLYLNRNVTLLDVILCQKLDIVCLPFPGTLNCMYHFKRDSTVFCAFDYPAGCLVCLPQPEARHCPAGCLVCLPQPEARHCPAGCLVCLPQPEARHCPAGCLVCLPQPEARHCPAGCLVCLPQPEARHCPAGCLVCLPQPEARHCPAE